MQDIDPACLDVRRLNFSLDFYFHLWYNTIRKKKGKIQK